jgi:predicted regulator of Ras-like GTPase activity (Roadblock/LC7/MglB family)
MKTPAAADLQRWSEDIARDATSLAFLPLARAYRRQGRRDAALRLCLKGLEAHPNHVEAHALLALLYLDERDRQRAADEWSTVLRLDTGNFEALRGLGFCYLENNELAKARYHLERAALVRPGDGAVQDALRLLRERIEQAAANSAPGPRATAARDSAAAADAVEGRGTPSSVPDEPRVAEPADAQSTADKGSAYDDGPVDDPAWRAGGELPPAALRHTAPARGMPAGTPPATANGAGGFTDDPSTLFDSFLVSEQLLGALVLDGRGLVLAGRLGSDGDGQALGALIGGTIGEAGRAVTHLELGAWHGMLVETAAAIVHVAPIADDAMVLIAAKRSAPMGWVLRTAAQAGSHATQFLGVA